MKEGLVGGEGFAIDASVIKADANRSRKIGGDEPIDLRDARHGTRAVREDLAALDAHGEPITPPASISPTDPAARWTAAPGGPAFYAYSTNYLIDVQAGIIVDVEATPALRTVRGQFHPDHDRARRRTVQPETRAPDRRHGLWRGPDARV